MKTLSITSGKGGVGKSVVATNLGIELSRMGKRVLLFDADMGLANVDILCGISCEYTLIDVVEGTKQMHEILAEGPHGMRILPASSGILKLERLSQAHLIRIAQGLQQLSEDFDVLLIDTGAGLSENVLFFNSCVDEVTVVATPDPTSLTDAYAVIKILTRDHGVRSVVLIINRANSSADGEAAYNKLSQVCTRFLQLELKYWGALVKDDAVEAAVRDRNPVVIRTPTAAVSRCFTELAGRFDQTFTEPVGGLTKDFWEKLLSQRFPAAAEQAKN